MESIIAVAEARNERRVDARVRQHAVAAALIGNMLEWYDFAVYGFLALTIGRLFFPNSDETASLLASVAAFGVGFLMRPLGAIVLARIIHRHARGAVASVA